MSQQTSPSQPIDYASKVPSNPAATASLVYGLLFFVFPFVPGLLALYWGRKGLRAASESAIGRRSATWGIRLGWVNLLLSVLVAVAVPISFVRARHAALQVACAANMRQIGLAVIQYSFDWNRTPSSLDVLFSGITRRDATGQVRHLPGYLLNPRVLDCPACSGDPAMPPVAMLRPGPTHYHILLPNPPVDRSSIKQPNRRVLLYESLSNHEDGGANFLFFDGHVEHLEGTAAKRLIASLKAQQAGAASRADHSPP